MSRHRGRPHFVRERAPAARQAVVRTLRCNLLLLLRCVPAAPIACRLRPTCQRPNTASGCGALLHDTGVPGPLTRRSCKHASQAQQVGVCDGRGEDAVCLLLLYAQVCMCLRNTPYNTSYVIILHVIILIGPLLSSFHLLQRRHRCHCHRRRSRGESRRHRLVPARLTGRASRAY